MPAPRSTMKKTSKNTPTGSEVGFKPVTPQVDFPALEKSLGLLNEIKLVADEKEIGEYKDLANTNESPSGVVKWDSDEVAQKARDFGRSTRAGISVALDIAKQVNDKTFLVIAYDKANRYDKKSTKHEQVTA